MPYTPQTWNDNNPNYPASAEWFTVMELGIANATALAEWGNRRFVNVMAPPYNAAADGTTDDSGAINAAILDVNSLGGGIVYLPRGTYGLSASLVLRTGVMLLGDGVGVTLLRASSGTNITVLTTLDFALLTTTNVSGGPERFGMSSITIDGNKANNTLSGHGVQLYGKNFLFRDFEVWNCRQNGWYSEWFASGDAMESQVSHFKIVDCNAHGLRVMGPHGSNFMNGQVIRCGTDGSSDAVNVGASEAVDVSFTNVHTWGGGTHGFYVTAPGTLFTSCVAEGATAINVWVDAVDVRWVGGRIHGNGASDTSIGLRIGNTATSTFPARCSFTTSIGDSQTLVHFMREGGGNRFLLDLKPVASGVPLLGAQHVSDLTEFVWENSAANTDASVRKWLQFPGDLRLSQAGGGLSITEGTNAKMGVASLTAGTATVTTTQVTANSRIFLNGQSAGGTHGELTVSARTAGTSFTITSASGTDTRTVAWLIVEPY